MDGEINYTPLDSFKVSPEKKPQNFSNKILIGLIAFFVIGIGTVSYLLVLQKPITRKTPATTVDLTGTPVPTTLEASPAVTTAPAEASGAAQVEPTVAEPTLQPATESPESSTTASLQSLNEQEPTVTQTPEPTETPIPLACGTQSCDDETNPCKNGLVCVQADDGKSYCSQPNYQDACVSDASQESCCTAPVGGIEEPTPTETELLTDQASDTSDTSETSDTSSDASSGNSNEEPEIPAAGIATFGVMFGLLATGIIIFGLIF